MSADLTPEKRAEWRRLCNAATPGPWRWDGRVLVDARPVVVLAADTDDGGPVAPSYADAALIAAARSALPRLLDALDAAEAERDKARADFAFMVERAAATHLDGYRELGARAAAAENASEALRRERDEALRQLGLERARLDAAGCAVFAAAAERDRADREYARGVAEERARVVVWLREDPPDDGWNHAFLVAAIARGDHEAGTAPAGGSDV